MLNGSRATPRKPERGRDGKTTDERKQQLVKLFAEAVAVAERARDDVGKDPVL